MTERRRLVPLLVALLWLLARPAWAIEYEVFVDVDDEEELYDLYVTGQIGEGTYVTLVDLLRRGTNLDEATREDLYALPNLSYADVDRILAYRTEVGTIRDPAALVAAGVLDEKTMASIAAFLAVGDTKARKAPVSGFVQYQTVWTARDRRAPPMVLQARVTTLRHLTVGIAAQLNRNRLGPVSWDPNREALVAEPNRTRPWLPKAFIQWDTPKYGVIAGTYRIGFGQRLTFDNSGRYTPNGFYLDDAYVRRINLTRLCKESTGELDEPPCDGDVYGTPDYRFRYGLLGVAAGAKQIDVGTGWLQAYGFFSYQPHDINQYQVYDRDRCDDPTVDDDSCKAPPLFKAVDPPLAEAPGYSFQSLPNVVAVGLGGGNFSWFYDRRTHVGVTGFGAAPRFLVQGANLDFRPYSPFPYGGAFGAVGADASWGHRWADLFFEFARSFDNQERVGGGGYAALLRHTATWDVHEIEVSGRFYDDDFNNPYARPIAAADQTGGLRASNEAGVRVRYSALLAKRVVLRTFFDVWSDVADARPQIRTYVRADVDATKWFRPGLWAEVQDRDARDRNGPESYCDLGDNSFDLDPNDTVVEDESEVTVPDDDDLTDSTVACTGERYSLTGRMRFQPHDRVWFSLQYRHDLTEDSDYRTARHDANAFFLLSTRPIDPLRIRSRVRFYDDDLQNNHRYSREVWWFIDVSYRVARWLTPKIRYDLIFLLDERDSTLARVPNPEHWLWFELESRF